MTQAERMQARPLPSGVRARGVLRVPASKSLTQRYLNLALLGRSQVLLEEPLLADDTRLFLSALGTLGWRTEQRAADLLLAPGRAPSQAEIDCGNNGTMLRFLTATLSTVPGRWRLDGSPRLRQRPVGALVEALHHLGAQVEWARRPGYPPLEVVGGSLKGGFTVIEAAQSSQFLSALLMAAVGAREEVVVEIGSLTSSPYLELTLASMERFGAEVERLGDRGLKVQPRRLRGGRFRVEGDFSSAAYPAAAAALTGGEVRLQGLQEDSRQGDREFLDLLCRMGARIEWRGSEVTVEGGGGLLALDVDLSGMPDQVPTLAALAPFASGVTRIRNVAQLRLKESDRLRAMTLELGRLGVDVSEQPDGLVIQGRWPKAPPSDVPVVVASHGDHRVAMSLALVGLRRPGVTLADPWVVEKSYPSFWDDLELLTHR